MEELATRLEDYNKVLNILDGVNSYPNLAEEYAAVVRIISQIHKEIDILKERLAESQRIGERQEAASGALDQMRHMIKHINDNATFYSQFIQDDESRISVNLDPRAHSSPISFNSLASFGPTTPAIHQPEAHPQAVQPKTPKPARNLDIALSYVSNEDFNKVPPYMKGRIRFEEVNTFVSQFNAVLNQKYALLKKPRNAVKLKKEMDLVIEWNGQTAAALKDQYFVTAKDFVSLSNLKLSKKDFSIIIILRHVKLIKETRVGKNVYYVACF